MMVPDPCLPKCIKLIGYPLFALALLFAMEVEDEYESSGDGKKSVLPPVE